MMEIDITGLLNLPGMAVVDFKFTEFRVDVKLKRLGDSGKCPLCCRECKTVRSYTVRELRDLDLLGRKTYLSVESRQFECGDCGRYFTEDIGIVEGNAGRTARYDARLYMLMRDGNIRQVSLQEDVCWATLNGIYKRFADRELAGRSACREVVGRLSIDEISVKKGKKDYACVIMDAGRGVVIDFLKSREMSVLREYFKKKAMNSALGLRRLFLICGMVTSTLPARTACSATR
jgi:transposase